VEIRDVILKHAGALRACYAAEAQGDTTLNGQVKVIWRIDPSGVVTSASIATSTVGSACVDECVLREVTRWHFPSRGVTTNVVWPIRFAVR
jgi:TonB family protein